MRWAGRFAGGERGGRLGTGQRGVHQDRVEVGSLGLQLLAHLGIERLALAPGHELRDQHDGQSDQEHQSGENIHLNRDAPLGGTPDIDRERDQRAGVEEADDEVVEAQREAQ